MRHSVVGNVALVLWALQHEEADPSSSAEQDGSVLASCRVPVPLKSRCSRRVQRRSKLRRTTWQLPSHWRKRSGADEKRRHAGLHFGARVGVITRHTTQASLPQ